MSTQSNGDMSLKEHMDLLGLDVAALAFASKVERKVIQRVLDAQPVAKPDAERLCAALSKAHGLNHLHSVGFQPEHITGMQVYEPPSKHHVRTTTFERNFS